MKYQPKLYKKQNIRGKIQKRKQRIREQGKDMIKGLKELQEDK